MHFAMMGRRYQALSRLPSQLPLIAPQKSPAREGLGLDRGAKMGALGWGAKKARSASKHD